MAIDQQLWQLKERVKELTLLHQATRLLQQENAIEKLLHEFVRIVPPAWQFPEIAEARVAVGDIEVATPGFINTPWIQRAEFPVRPGTRGVLEVVYLTSPPAGPDGPFLQEERQLMTSLAALLASKFDGMHRAQERLELARAEASRMEAEAANRQKDAFLAAVSHELRRPLTAILGWIRILRNSDTEDMERGLEVIERSANIQLRLIEELLDMSRIGAGQLDAIDATFSPVNVDQILDNVVNAAMPAAANRKIDIVKRADGACPPVLGDAMRLQQVVGNLMGNALKFTPAGGRITLTLERSDREAAIEVADTGVGIDPSALPRIFEPFWQADASTSPSREGLGLGLSIVRRLVELHGGTIEAVSDGSGRGTRMIVRLPLSSAPAIEQTAPSPVLP